MWASRKALASLLVLLAGLAYAESAGSFADKMVDGLRDFVGQLAREWAINSAKEVGNALVNGRQPDALNTAPGIVQDGIKGLETLKFLDTAYQRTDVRNSALFDLETKRLEGLLERCKDLQPGQRLPQECRPKEADQRRPSAGTSRAIVSYIEGLPDVQRDQGTLLDRLPKVFFVDAERLAECRRLRFDLARCERFEWRSPMMLESHAFAVERRISHAWNRYDAIRFWRVSTALATGRIACLTGVPDMTLYPFDGAFTFEWISGSELCEGYDMPLLPVVWLPGICGTRWEVFVDWDDAIRRWRDAQISAYKSHYLKRYWLEVGGAVALNMPGALMWDSLIPEGFGESGVLVSPIAKLGLNIEQYRESVRQAVRLDPLRGASYWIQTLPGAAETSRMLRTNILDGDNVSALNPGYRQMEDLKRGYSNREGIHSRLHQFYPWGVGLFTGGAAPQGKTGAASPAEYELFGTASFFALRSEWVYPTELSPRGTAGMVPFGYFCNTFSLPPTQQPRLVVFPLVNFAPRVQTHWFTVAEGQSLPWGKGTPTSLLELLEEKGIR